MLLLYTFHEVTDDRDKELWAVNQCEEIREGIDQRIIFLRQMIWSSKIPESVFVE